MAAGDRYKSGKPKDIVRHYTRNMETRISVCGRVRPGYVTDDVKDVTCKQCLKNQFYRL